MADADRAGAPIARIEADGSSRIATPPVYQAVSDASSPLAGANQAEATPAGVGAIASPTTAVELPAAGSTAAAGHPESYSGSSNDASRKSSVSFVDDAQALSSLLDHIN